MKKGFMKFMVSVIAFVAIVLCAASLEAKAADKSIDEVLAEATDKVKSSESIMYKFDRDANLFVEQMDSLTYKQHDEGFFASDDKNAIGLLLSSDGSTCISEYILQDENGYRVKLSLSGEYMTLPYNQADEMFEPGKKFIYLVLSNLENVKIKKETKNYYTISGTIGIDDVPYKKATVTISKKDCSVTKVKVTIEKFAASYANVDIDYEISSGTMTFSHISYSNEKVKLPKD